MFAPGMWVGIELAQAAGKNDGTVKDVRYFTCAPMHGVFVRPGMVFSPGQELELRETLSRRGSRKSIDSLFPAAVGGATTASSTQKSTLAAEATQQETNGNRIGGLLLRQQLAEDMEARSNNKRESDWWIQGVPQPQADAPLRNGSAKARAGSSRRRKNNNAAERLPEGSPAMPPSSTVAKPPPPLPLKIEAARSETEQSEWLPKKSEESGTLKIIFEEE
jgi:hypothetical protein